MAIEILRTPDFDVWLKQLRDRRGAARIAERIDRMRVGNFGDFKFVGSGVSELRIGGAGPGYRAYFTRRGDTLVLLLCGGDKDSQQRDIERAKDMLKEIDL